MDPIQLAEIVRAACVEAATGAYDDAGLRGLCEEGRWEVAVGAIRSLDLERLVRPHLSDDGRAGAPGRRDPPSDPDSAP